MPKESSGFSDRSLDRRREDRDFFFFLGYVTLDGFGSSDVPLGLSMSVCVC